MRTKPYIDYAPEPVGRVVYCIDCEREVVLQNSAIGYCHEYEERTEYGTELDWCMFDLGLAYCPPPTYPEFWDDDLKIYEEDYEFEEELV